MAGLTPQQTRLINYFQDRKAWFKSLFDIVPIPRKNDDWYYWNGKLMSAYDVFIDPRFSIFCQFPSGYIAICRTGKTSSI